MSNNQNIFTRRQAIHAMAALGLLSVSQAGFSQNKQLAQITPGNSGASIRKVLWAANVRTKTLQERLTAAKQGQFTHMSVFPADYAKWISLGLTGQQIKQTIHAAGIRVLAIDPFVQWVPNFVIPSYYPADYRSFIDFTESQIFEMARQLEAETINCVEGLGQTHPQNDLVERFAQFADRAKAQGLKVTLEFMPISSIPDLSSAWEIVKAADRDNAGLCFDTWHYFRSKPDDALLKSIPGSKIFEVQLADALLKLQGKNLTEDLLRFRRLPGDGELPLKPVVDILKQIGAWRSVGPEVFADAMDAKAASQVGIDCAASLVQWL